MSNKLDNFLQNKQQTQPQNTPTETTETQEISASEQLVGLVESLYKEYEPMVAIAGQLLSIKIATAINKECQKTLLGLATGETNFINSEALADAKRRLAIADNNVYSQRLLLTGKANG